MQLRIVRVEEEAAEAAQRERLGHDPFGPADRTAVDELGVAADGPGLRHRRELDRAAQLVRDLGVVDAVRRRETARAQQDLRARARFVEPERRVAGDVDRVGRDGAVDDGRLRAFRPEHEALGAVEARRGAADPVCGRTDRLVRRAALPREGRALRLLLNREHGEIAVPDDVRADAFGVLRVASRRQLDAVDHGRVDLEARPRGNLHLALLGQRERQLLGGHHRILSVRVDDLERARARRLDAGERGEDRGRVHRDRAAAHRDPARRVVRLAAEQQAASARGRIVQRESALQVAVEVLVGALVPHRQDGRAVHAPEPRVGLAFGLRGAEAQRLAALVMAVQIVPAARVVYRADAERRRLGHRVFAAEMRRAARDAQAGQLRRRCVQVEFAAVGVEAAALEPAREVDVGLAVAVAGDLHRPRHAAGTADAAAAPGQRAGDLRVLADDEALRVRVADDDVHRARVRPRAVQIAQLPVGLHLEREAGGPERGRSRHVHQVVGHVDAARKARRVAREANARGHVLRGALHDEPAAAREPAGERLRRGEVLEAERRAGGDVDVLPDIGRDVRVRHRRVRRDGHAAVRHAAHEGRTGPEDSLSHLPYPFIRAPGAGAPPGNQPIRAPGAGVDP